jgi:hypothetical protein
VLLPPKPTGTTTPFSRLLNGVLDRFYWTARVVYMHIRHRHVRNEKDKTGSFLGDAESSWYRFVVSYYYQITELDKNSIFQRIFELSGGFWRIFEYFCVASGISLQGFSRSDPNSVSFISWNNFSERFDFLKLLSEDEMTFTWTTLLILLHTQVLSTAMH